MKISISIFAIALSFVSCNGDHSQQPERSDKSKIFISNMKLARDPHTWSKPNDARVTHLEWNAKVDFATKVISATATYNIENLTDTSAILFDTKGLSISRVEVDGKPVQQHLGEEKEFLGQPLSIPIDSTSKKVAITYTTSPAAEALLWVDGEKPFLFTQSQAILARTWIPCQDSPGVRFTYNATVEVPKNLLALMSAENPQQKNESGIYSFKMEQPIPSYLMALAVGDVEFRSVGKQTGVYAIPTLIDAAAKEFEDMQLMVEAAEKLYGPYVWGRYDLLILPPAFPFGGMENPRLTFATPTIIAGDKSLVALVAHELAHSWSGNLVTNSTWDDFWLNEGFTVYFEQRIMEAVFGRERSEMLAQLSRQDLDATIVELTASHPADTKLKLALEGRSPDDGMTDIAYNKGYFFIRLIEEIVGREKFDVFLKNYFTSHQFQVMDTETFLDYLRKNLVDAETEKKIDIDAWVYGEGIPTNAPVVNSDALARVDEAVKQWSVGNLKTSELKWNDWQYQEQYRFLTNIPESVPLNKLDELDAAFHINESGNSEVLFAWLEQSILKKRTASYARLEKFLVEVGRRKFVAPLFEAMKKTEQLDLAKRIYEKARPGYHSVTTGTVDEMLGWSR
ncbi:MAG: M1 family metallopeptidase [Flavobacteriales bacterium]|nr:M1 family metallopeptidase [Flavobacteriales bacterium]